LDGTATSRAATADQPQTDLRHGSGPPAVDPAGRGRSTGSRSSSASSCSLRRIAFPHHLQSDHDLLAGQFLNMLPWPDRPSPWDNPDEMTGCPRCVRGSCTSTGLPARREEIAWRHDDDDHRFCAGLSACAATVRPLVLAAGLGRGTRCPGAGAGEPGHRPCPVRCPGVRQPSGGQASPDPRRRRRLGCRSCSTCGFVCGRYWDRSTIACRLRYWV
jgi:hypothetical protein